MERQLDNIDSFTPQGKGAFKELKQNKGRMEAEGNHTCSLFLFCSFVWNKMLLIFWSLWIQFGLWVGFFFGRFIEKKWVSREKEAAFEALKNWIFGMYCTCFYFDYLDNIKRNQMFLQIKEYNESIPSHIILALFPYTLVMASVSTKVAHWYFLLILKDKGYDFENDWQHHGCKAVNKWGLFLSLFFKYI